MRVVGLAELVNPVIFPELAVQVQVNKEPVTFEVSVILVSWLLHCCLLLGVFERSGVGYTVTV